MEQKAAHTPGPWIADLGEAYRVRAQQDGGQVAIMMSLKGQHGLAGRRSGDEVAANARLIAAAPDLLEALIAITNQLERIGDTREHKDGAFIRDARAAIAKATGSAV